MTFGESHVKTIKRTNSYILCLIGVLIATIIWDVNFPALAASAPERLPNRPAEQWILKQIASGKVADLRENFSKESDRIISASFIEKLLTDSLKDVKVHWHGVRIAGAVVVDPIDLANAEIRHPTLLIDFHFKKEMDLSGSVFRKSLSFEGSSFKQAKFNVIKVGGDAVFSKAVFLGSAVFTDAEIPGNFEADDAVFTGPAQFLRMDIAGMLLADRAQFQNAEGVTNFNSIKVGVAAFFNDAVFAGSVNFVKADIAGNFDADGAQFQNAQKAAQFATMKVGGSVFIRRAVFAGPVSFAFADIAENFEAHKTKFKNTSKGANLNFIKVGGNTLFQGSVFSGELSMQNSELVSLVIQGHKETCCVLPLLDLRAAVLKSTLNIDDVKLRDIFAASLRVGGPTYLNRLTIEGEANLEHSSFITLALSDVSWPKNSNLVRLDGMTYQHISVGKEKESWRKLLELANQSRYSAAVYANLEAFFRREGYPGRADDVFVAQKERERDEFLGGLPWLSNLLLGILVRHGRSPHRAFALGVFFVFIGCLVFFRSDGMESQKAEDVARKYNALWYSLDLFLPFIDLQAASVWTPKHDRWFARNYMRVHTILGWVLIPIGLAAITGIIR